MWNKISGFENSTNACMSILWETPDMEIGPDEEMSQTIESARLIEMVRGAEEVDKMDALLSLAVTGGDFSWI